ncbi:MAG: hypothetical protein NVS3B3_16570 [Aquirhabdus sp.]
MMKKTLFFASLAALCCLHISKASDDKIGVSSDYPSLSPSGTVVVFSADFEGQVRLWSSGLNGANLHKVSQVALPNTSIAETEPAWSPDGRQIAYVSTNNGVSDIWVIQADGSYSVKLTTNGANNTQPAWSPDGRKLVFVSDKGGSKDIWLMNANGSNQTSIVALPGEENHPSFSPAGDKIVFSETANGSATLVIANADGSGVTQLTKGNFQDWDPYWGANGIIFASNRDTSSEHWKIWAIEPNGTNLRKVGDIIGQNPVWMGDGRVLFTDEVIASKALSAVSIFNPVTRAKQIVVNVQGYSTPIDIRPGKAINYVNPNSRGNIEVAILSTRTFDAFKAVNQNTITFGRTGDENSLKHCSKKARDVNHNGLPALVCHFRLGNTGFRSGDSVGILRFTGNNATPYEGRDAITTVTKDDPDDFKDED